jgi:molybdopterin/thiamine biosynthesis adenylyltransferase
MIDWPQPLIRNRGALSASDQQRLREAHVLVCGCGGLGGLVIENLARLGVGSLLLSDPDSFSRSNLNRQLGALQQTLGQNKAEVMAKRVHEIHDLCQVEALADDFREIMSFQGIDIVIDCLDDTGARLELAGRCRRQRLPLVHGAVNGWYGQVGVQLPENDLLSRLYPGQEKKTQPVPVLSFTATLVASLQAAETVKLLIGRPSRLTRGWMSIDLLAGDFDFFQ